jgi:hypothetical protein
MATSLSQQPASNPARQQLDELDALLQRMLDLPVQYDEQPAAEEPPASSHTEQELESEPVETEQAEPIRVPRPPVSYTVSEMISAPLSTGQQQSSATDSEEQREKPRSTPTNEQSSEDETWVPFRSSWQPSPQTWQPLAETWQKGRAAQMPQSAATSGPAAPPEAASPTAPAEDGAEPPRRHHEVAEETLFQRRRPRPRETVVEPPVGRFLTSLIWCNKIFDYCLTPLGTPGAWLKGPRGRSILGLIGLMSLGAAVLKTALDRMGWTW